MKITTQKTETHEGAAHWDVLADGVLIGTLEKGQPCRYSGKSGWVRDRSADWRLWFTPTNEDGSVAGRKIRLAGITTLAEAREWLRRNLTPSDE